ncbi:MAG: outer surface protein [Clostridiaceae bacterium]|jgi:hypothetical protein|nr:outer surface protein [Clostridiaceae bacterium]
MSKGISVYLGMNYSIEENIRYIKRAKEYGFDNIFTSLHIPEANYSEIIEDFKKIVALAKALDLKIIADISPRAFGYLGADIKDLSVLKDMNIYGIRVDFGFSPKEIAEFTNNKYGLKIEINASTVTERFLNEFDKYNPNYKMLQACHNYYPRLNTGISVETLLKKNNMLKQYEIKLSAFIPSQSGRRGPIFEGLPTLEAHRNMKSEICAKHLFALGLDNVIFGDSIPSDEELVSVGNIEEDIIEFNIKELNCSEIENEILFKSTHENRPDSAEDVIRSTLSRETLNGRKVEPKNNIKRIKGSITIDNEKYMRYCGELQICKKDLPADSRVNVVGVISKEELFLIDFIKEETKFKFISESKFH